MSGKSPPINRDIAYLLPLPLQDWLPEKHLTRSVWILWFGSIFVLWWRATLVAVNIPITQPHYGHCCSTVMRWGYANQLEAQLHQEVQELLRWVERADAPPPGAHPCAQTDRVSTPGSSVGSLSVQVNPTPRRRVRCRRV